MPPLKMMLTPFQRRKLERQARADKYGSPTYAVGGTAGMAALAASTSLDHAVASEFPAAKKYEPLDWMEIVNNDTVDIAVTLNGRGGDYFMIPASSIRTVNIPFSIFRVTNLDAANATTLGAITITLQKKPKTADDVARMEV